MSTAAKVLRQGLTLSSGSSLHSLGAITGPAEVLSQRHRTDLFPWRQIRLPMPIGGTTEYVWTVPAGWNITAGQGTRQITVNIGGTAGTRTVSVINRYTTLPMSFAFKNI
ncbi:MAG: hypothetical protein MZV63_47140 [Marinilabiliales bacterium]|nr:hypothetical protein [Marinilabiliales bacterium]